ncbi:MAG: beta strand repeat-containing protein, partial [Candidatus Saccharimonadales bacterium]
GQIKLNYAGQTGSVTLAVANPSSTGYTITIPAETGQICTTAASAACTAVYAPAGGGYVNFAPNAVQADASNNNTVFINKTSGTGNILELQKSASDVFKIDNGGNVTSTGNVSNSGQNTLSRNGVGSTDYTLGVTGAPVANSTSALVRIGGALSGGNGVTNGGTYLGIVESTSGAGSAADFLNLQNGLTTELAVSSAGNITVHGTYNGNTFTSSALQFSAASAATLQPAASQALTITGHATSTWSLDAGNLTLQTTAANSSLTLDAGTAGSGTITIGSNANTLIIANSGSQSVSIASSTGTNTVTIGASGSATNTVTIGTTNSTSTTTIKAGTGGINLTPNGSSNTGVLIKPTNNSTAAFSVQPSASTTPVIDVDTSNGRIGINTASPSVALSINSGTSGNSGLQFTQLNSNSAASSSFSQLLGLDSSGDVGLSSAGLSLTSPALAYWDGLNDPTSSSQAYPPGTLSGNATYTGATNGVELTTATNYEYGAISWDFSQVSFEETQFQFKAGTGSADSTWFYGYADSTPTTEYGCNAVPNSGCNGTTGPFIGAGYIVYFSEYGANTGHGCIGISWGGFKDGNQCNNGGGTSNSGASPLKSVNANALGITINDNNFHQVDIQILYNVITVRWDGRVIMTETDAYGRDLSHLNYGFGSRTGGQNNTHYVKGLLVTKLGTNVSEFNINDISPLTNDLQNTSDNLYWQNSTGYLGINTYTPSASLDVNGTANLEGNVTLGSLGSGGTTQLCTNGSNVISTCSGGSGGTVVDQRTNTGTHTYTESTAASGYYLGDTEANTTSNITFNITGVSNTEGSVVYIGSYATKTSGTNALHVYIDINGTQISSCNVSSVTTDTENYIAMYINGSWRIMGYGNITSGGANTYDTADYAEWIDYVGDTAPQAGDVLTVDSAGKAVDDATAPYDSHLIGVVSTSPYQVGGQDDGHSVVLALTGRVPVKVNLENGPIAVGDPLTSSSVPGEAMKATAPGKIIGMALEGYDGTQDSNEINVQLGVSYNDPTDGSGQLQGSQTVNGDLGVTGSGSLQGGLKVGGNLTVSSGLNVTGASIMDSLQLTSGLNVAGAALFTSLAAQTMSVSGNLNVAGTITALNLAITGNLTTQNVTISGITSLNGDIKLTAQVNTRQATIKTFTASKQINAGEVVILDDTKGNEGQVTTTTQAADPRVIGVAVTDAAKAGDSIDIAIGGWVQVKVDTTPDSHNNPPPALVPGQLLVTSANEGTAEASGNPPPGSLIGKTTSQQDIVTNLVWVLVLLQ